MHLNTPRGTAALVVRIYMSGSEFILDKFTTLPCLKNIPEEQ